MLTLPPHTYGPVFFYGGLVDFMHRFNSTIVCTSQEPISILSNENEAVFSSRKKLFLPILTKKVIFTSLDNGPSPYFHLEYFCLTGYLGSSDSRYRSYDIPGWFLIVYVLMFMFILDKFLKTTVNQKNYEIENLILLNSICPYE